MNKEIGHQNGTGNNLSSNQNNTIENISHRLIYFNENQYNTKFDSVLQNIQRVSVHANITSMQL